MKQDVGFSGGEVQADGLFHRVGLLSFDGLIIEEKMILRQCANQWGQFYHFCNIANGCKPHKYWVLPGHLWFLFSVGLPTLRAARSAIYIQQAAILLLWNIAAYVLLYRNLSHQGSFENGVVVV